jgi:hypothetical protein
MLARFVVLAPAEYQKLQNQIEGLKRQLQANRLEAPSTCRLSGRVEGDNAYLHALFEFKTERPNTLVNLGCQRGWPTDARLDGQLPTFPPREDGLVILVDRPGVHQATVDLVVPLSARKGPKGPERGFDLGLPRAAITTLEQLDLPHSVAELRLGSRTLRPTPVDGKLARVEKAPVVPLDRLDVGWKAAAEPVKGAPVLAASSHLVVRVNESHVFINAEITLEVIRGETTQWRLHIPAPADASVEVKAHPQDETLVAGVDRPVDKLNPIWTVRLKDPGSEKLRVLMQIHQPRSGNPVPIGPFTVLDTLTQNGTGELRCSDDLRLRFESRAEVSPREITEEQVKEEVKAAFRYWNLPSAVSPTVAVPPLLSLEVEPARGAVESRVSQRLRLVESDSEVPPRWQLTSKWEITPVRTGLDRFTISLPPDYTYERVVESEPAEIVDEVVLDRAARTALIRLTQKQRRRFSVTLAGSYPQPAGKQEATLSLPQPLAWSVERRLQSERPATTPAQRLPIQDRGAQINVSLPAGLELTPRQLQGKAVPPIQGAFRAFLLPAPRPSDREYSWQTETAPPVVELAWAVHRPDLRVQSTVDLILKARQAQVQQQFVLEFGQPPASMILLKIPAELQGRITVIDGATRTAEESNRSGTLFRLQEPVGKTHKLTIAYSFVLPEQDKAADRASERRFIVPLIQPANALQSDTKVRIWSEPGDQVFAANSGWEELPTEATERKSLPDLVLRGNAGSLLTLGLRSGDPAVVSTTIVERALIHAVVAEGGYQTYRARFLISKFNSRSLVVQLPMGSSHVEVLLDRKSVRARYADEPSRQSDPGTHLRLSVEPDLYPQPVVLDLSYQLDPGRSEGNSPVQSTLRPPEIVGAFLLGRVRWQVELPSGWLTIYVAGSYGIERQWAWTGRLPGLRPALSSQELEQWFSAADKTEPAAANEPALVCSQTTVGPVQLNYVPETAWLLACSLSCLVLGIVFLYAPLPRWLSWTFVLACGAGAGAAGIFWPGFLAVLAYGCELGLLILIVLAAVQWLLHARYRRQVVFMPGFTRLKTGSSLQRAASNLPRPPSTVDEPPKRGSSVTSGVRPQGNGI